MIRLALILAVFLCPTAYAQRAVVIQRTDGTYAGIFFLPNGQTIALEYVEVHAQPGPSPPPVPPVTTGARDIVIIRESSQVDAKMASAQTLLQSDPVIMAWKQQKKHRVIYLDPDDKDETGTRPSPTLTKYRSLLPSGQQLPAIVIADAVSGVAYFAGSYELNWKASDIVELVKRHGG